MSVTPAARPVTPYPSTRVVTFNLCASPDRMAARLADAAEQLEARSPDIVCLQEVTFPADGGPSTAELLADALGLQVAAVAPSPVPTAAGNRTGTAILSRYPVLDGGPLPLHAGLPRPHGWTATWAQLASASGRTITALSAHLTWGDRCGPVRLEEAAVLDEAAATLTQPGGFAVLGMDANSTPDSAPIRYLTGADVVDGRSAFWVDAWTAAGDGSAGATTGPENELAAATARRVGLEFPELLPARRIDYLMTRGWRYACPGAAVACRLLCTTPSGPDDVVASDHYALETDLLDPALPD